MAALHIRHIPEEALAALKRRAKLNHRSLQKEVRLILLEAAGKAPPVEPLPPIRLIMSNSNPDTDWSRDEIYGDDGR